MENKIWNIKPPEKKGDYICRMTNAYIKMCHWDGEQWLDMWKPTLDGAVVEWMHIPIEKPKTEDLKPCPFCGKELAFTDPAMRSVKCANCGATVITNGHNETIYNAINLWNNRPLTNDWFDEMLVFIEDKKLGGGTIWFKIAPQILAEGDNYEDAKKKLMDTLLILAAYKEIIKL